MGWWSRRKRGELRGKVLLVQVLMVQVEQVGVQQLPQIIVLFLLHFLELGGDQ